METKRKTWELHQSIVSRVLAVKPEHKSATAFLEDLVVKGLNAGFADLTLPPLQSPHTSQIKNNNQEHEGLRGKEGLGGCREANGYKGREGEKGSKRFVFEVPDSLEWCKDELLVYWKEAKAGKKTIHAANLLFNELEKIESKYGKPVALEQIGLATANNWKSITAVNYERNMPSFKKAIEPEIIHPAQKEFKPAPWQLD